MEGLDMKFFNLATLLAVSVLSQNTLASDNDGSMTLAALDINSSYKWSQEKVLKEQRAKQKISFDKTFDAMNDKINAQMQTRIEEMMSESLQQ